jgi:hypothetical protein
VQLPDGGAGGGAVMVLRGVLGAAERAPWTSVRGWAAGLRPRQDIIALLGAGCDERRAH